MSVAEQLEKREADRKVFQDLPANHATPPVDRIQLQDAIKLYKSVGHRNPDYFTWLHNTYSWICLRCTSPDYRKVLGDDKTKMAIFDILVDDLADNSNTRSQFLLDQFIRIPWRDTQESNEYLIVGRKIWEDFIGSVRQYPRFKDFERIFYFDLHQILASMVYSSIVNSLDLDNPLEMSFYSSYGCMVILALDLDLMCSPGFDMKDLGAMRSIACLAQRVAHIGNMLSTYRGEVLEKDRSSPIISLALRRHLVSKEELGTDNAISKISTLEWMYKRRAHSYIQKIAAFEKEIQSVDVRGFSGLLTELLERFGDSKAAR